MQVTPNEVVAVVKDQNKQLPSTSTTKVVIEIVEDQNKQLPLPLNTSSIQIPDPNVVDDDSITDENSPSNLFLLMEVCKSILVFSFVTSIGSFGIIQALSSNSLEDNIKNSAFIGLGTGVFLAGVTALSCGVTKCLNATTHRVWNATTHDEAEILVSRDLEESINNIDRLSI